MLAPTPEGPAMRITAQRLLLAAAVLSGCGEIGGGKKDGALCSVDSECQHDSCSNGMCFNSRFHCWSDSDCDSGAYCDSDTEWCVRRCTAGCGTQMSCLTYTGVCA